MKTILYLCHPDSRGIEEKFLSPEDPLPTLEGICTRDFLRGSHTDIAWTDQRLLCAYRRLCAAWGEKIPCCGGFRRLQDHVCRGFPAHYAGLALNLCPQAEQLEALRRLAVSLGCFSCVAPVYLAPSWLHVEVLTAPPALPYCSYPVLSHDLCGVHVFLLQDALMKSGDHHGALTGKVDVATLDAAARFRHRMGLPPLPCIDGQFWQALFFEAQKRPFC